jgi:hypothetical protein
VSALGRKWDDGKYQDVEVCCPEFAEATQSETYEQGYDRSLLGWWDCFWYFGSYHERLRFCPWCGAKLESDQAAKGAP